jgi:Protein of unknown function (DUF4446)
VEQTLRDIAPYVALGAAVAAIVVAVLLGWLLVSVRRLRRAQQVVIGAHGERDLVAHAEGLDAQVHNLRDAVEALDRRIEGHKLELDKAFAYRAVLRYDAFRESSGEQSCSIALLDRSHSGVVISTITSRDEARIYVKELRQGVPDRALSPEEVAVVEQAVSAPAPTPAGATDGRQPESQAEEVPP